MTALEKKKAQNEARQNDYGGDVKLDADDLDDLVWKKDKKDKKKKNEKQKGAKHFEKLQKGIFWRL